MIYAFYGRLSVGTTDVDLLARRRLPPHLLLLRHRDPFYREFLANADAAEAAGFRWAGCGWTACPMGFGAQGDWIPHLRPVADHRIFPDKLTTAGPGLIKSSAGHPCSFPGLPRRPLRGRPSRNRRVPVSTRRITACCGAVAVRQRRAAPTLQAESCFLGAQVTGENRIPVFAACARTLRNFDPLRRFPQTPVEKAEFSRKDQERRRVAMGNPWKSDICLKKCRCTRRWPPWPSPRSSASW